MTWADLVNYTIVVISTLVRLAVVGLIVSGLIKYNSGLGVLERAGMGLIGGPFLMTIPIVLDTDRTGTPFDTWAGTILAFGILLFIVGRLIRLGKHAANNQAQIDAALIHANEKRKREKAAR